RDRDTRTAVLEKDPTTVLEQGQFCTIDAATGLAVKATAASTSIALVIATPETGSGLLADNKVQVSADFNAVLVGTADAPFAKTNRNTEVDIAIDGSGNQLIDIAASTTDVLVVLASEDAGTVGSAEEVLVKVNKPLSL
ncbi:MAG: hypothetical protein GY861_10280, partial [bacterium]|nr:hypothetical protein [bacterium]